MEYANNLTQEQIKQFIEQTFNVKIKRIVLKDLETHMAKCYFKIKGGEKFYFLFNDFTFNFPYSKFGLTEQSSQIRKNWYKYMAGLFGKDYVVKLNKHLESQIDIQKTLTKHRMELVKNKYTSYINSLQTKIDLLNSAIKQAEDRKEKELQTEEELLQKELTEITNCKLNYEPQQEK